MIRQVLIGNAILAVQYTVGGLVPLVLIPHIVRSIGLAAYGDIAVALAWASYAAVLVQYSFQYTGPRSLSQLQPGETERSVFGDLAAAKVVLLAPALLSMLIAALLLPASGHAGSQWALMAALPLAAALNTGWHLQTSGHFLRLCLCSIAGAAIGLLLGLTLVDDAAGGSILAAAASLGIGPLLAGLGTFLCSAWLLRGKPIGSRHVSPMRALRDGWPLFLSQFTSVLYTVSGPLVIRYCSGSEAAGAYSTVERLANALLGACLLTHTAAYPRLARQYQSDRAGYLSLMRFVVLVYVGCTAMIAAATLFARPIIVPYLFGTRQPDGVDALLVCALAWLMVGIAGTALTGYMSISGRQHLVLALNLRVLLIALCLGIPGSFFLGAWAWMGALVLSQAPLLWAAAKAWRAEQAGLQVA